MVLILVEGNTSGREMFAGHVLMVSQHRSHLEIRTLSNRWASLKACSSRFALKDCFCSASHVVHCEIASHASSKRSRICLTCTTSSFANRSIVVLAWRQVESSIPTVTQALNSSCVFVLCCVSCVFVLSCVFLRVLACLYCLVFLACLYCLATFYIQTTLKLKTCWA
jgi:hypothetical protein